MGEELEKTYTADEAATVLRVSVETVRHLCRTKQIGRLKIGRQYFIPESDLHTYRQSCYAPATT